MTVHEKERATQERTKLTIRVLPEKIQEDVATELQPVLVDLLAYSLVLKQAHWNVTGPQFRNAHLQLDEIFETTSEAIDEVAERMNALGVSPNGQPFDVAESSTVQPIRRGFQGAEVIVTEISERTERLIQVIRAHMDAVEDKDAATADLLHQIVLTLEKHNWMLRAQLA